MELWALSESQNATARVTNLVLSTTRQDSLAVCFNDAGSGSRERISLLPNGVVEHRGQRVAAGDALLDRRALTRGTARPV